MEVAVKTIESRIEELEKEIAQKKKDLAEMRRRITPEDIHDVALRDSEGNGLMLSELFGDKKELILIHNMGTKCPYCTLWADGFNGLSHHLENRAAFVVSSPDEPEVQRKFKESRGWKFKMVSMHGTAFIRELGFEREGRALPGVSILVKDEMGNITRVSRSMFGPGDNYCIAWDLFDLLPGGGDDWAPRFNY
jgi:predicted dithiol-disulfide oxidoreductase (DUF899 family)